MQLWSRIARSEVIRPILTLGIGSICAQLIPFAMSFVLARLYTPEEFGELGLFINYAGVLLIMASARYELAIVRARTEAEALSIAVLSVGIAFALCSCLGLIAGLSDIFQWAYLSQIPGKYLLPLFVFLSALFQVLVNYQNYREGYKSIAGFTIARNGIQAIARLLLSLFHRINGLIYGALIGVAGGCLLFLCKNTRHYAWNRVSPQRIGYALRRYANFPKYVLPSSLLNSLSTNLPVILFALFFTKQEVGYFTMTTTLFYLPISLFGNAIGQVFYKKASIWDLPNTAQFGWIVVCFSGLLSVLIALLLLVGNRYLFTFLLGKEWAMIGDYSIVLLPWFVLVLCFSPLSLIFDAKDKQLTEMYLNIAAFVLRVAAIFVGGSLACSAKQVILLYTLGGMLVWLVEGWVIFRILHITARRRLLFFIALFVLLTVWGGYMLCYDVI